VATTSHPAVPIAFGSGGTDPEGGRVFFQSRLALFGRWVSLVSGAFFLFSAVMRTTLDIPFIDSATWWHAASLTVAGLVWAAARWARLSMRVMEAVDALATLVLCATLGAMAGGYAEGVQMFGADPAPAFYIGLMAGGYVLIARAIALPSTPLRTIVVGVVATIPLVVIELVTLSRVGPLSGIPGMVQMDLVSWAVAGVAMSAVASRVIFGLRTEVSRSRRLGQYTLQEKIGEGGMGAVYKARHALLRRATAVKLLPPEKAGEDEVRRFEREVQLTAQLTHPNTVAIFDYGRTPDGIFYYAMEYLDGVALDRLVADHGAQPVGRVVHILQQVCGALAEAHDMGVIHRDVKPSNIMLCRRGGMLDVAKVVDFGLVRPFRPDGDQLTVAVTTTRTLMGTPHYMAPEAVTGGDQLDGRSDLYAVGAVGYFLLTGTPVFDAKTLMEVCAHHLHTTPERPSVRLGLPVPADVEAVLLHCLAKAPADRPADARSLHDALGRTAAAGQWSQADAARWWSAHRPAVTAAFGVPSNGHADAATRHGAERPAAV
jgi:serine/threonine-protein kinase